MRRKFSRASHARVDLVHVQYTAGRQEVEATVVECGLRVAVVGPKAAQWAPRLLALRDAWKGTAPPGETWPFLRRVSDHYKGDYIYASPLLAVRECPLCEEDKHVLEWLDADLGSPADED